MSADTDTQPDEADVKRKRGFKFPAAFTILLFVLVTVWILAGAEVPPRSRPPRQADSRPSPAAAMR